MIPNKKIKPGVNRKKIAIIANTSWYLFNFRSNLIKDLIRENYEVITIAPKDDYSPKLEEIGSTFYNIEIDSKSKNPFHDIGIIVHFAKIFKKTHPQILLNFTAKPNIYATLAGRLYGIPSVNNIAGLGSGFVQESVTTRILRFLYRTSQRKAEKIFFQNQDDFQEFLEHKIIIPENTSILPGSGVDLKRFQQQELPPLGKENKFTFLLISRVLYSKGIELLFNAASSIYSKGNKNFKVQIIGQTGVNNANAIPVSQIEEWNKKPYFEYLGKTDDVRPFISASHCVILPSFYREGTPKSILEGLALGRPIITTDMPGCRSTVIDEINGFLVLPRDVDDLEKKMNKILFLEIQTLKEMGQKSRRLAEEKFDEEIVIDQYLTAINQILSHKENLKKFN